MSKSVLLIGGSGLLGTALQHYLQEDDSFIVSAPSHDECDLLDVKHLHGMTYDIIVNLTGQVSSPMSLCRELNTTGIQNVLTAIHNSDTFLVQVSTVAVYGTTENVTESSSVHPETEYAECKAAADRLIQDTIPDDRYLIARLSNLYGPRQSKGLLWYLLHSIQEGQQISIADNDGTLCRYFLHVEDAAKIIYSLIKSNACGVVNIPGPDIYTISDLISESEKVLGRPIDVSYGTAAPVGNIGYIDDTVLKSYILPQYSYSIVGYIEDQLT